jgi:hypothetical protein
VRSKESHRLIAERFNSGSLTPVHWSANIWVKILLTPAQTVPSRSFLPKPRSFKCGPYALAEVRRTLRMPDPLAPAIREIKSPYRGFALTEVAQLASSLAMPNQMAKWNAASGEIPVPSVVHWKLDHYAAIVEQQGGNVPDQRSDL